MKQKIEISKTLNEQLDLHLTSEEKENVLELESLSAMWEELAHIIYYKRDCHMLDRNYLRRNGTTERDVVEDYLPADMHPKLKGLILSIVD